MILAATDPSEIADLREMLASIKLKIEYTEITFTQCTPTLPPSQSLTLCLASVFTQITECHLKAKKITSTYKRTHRTCLGYLTRNALFDCF